MHEVVRDVGKEGAFGFEDVDGAEGFVDGGVSGMRVVAESVEEENV